MSRLPFPLYTKFEDELEQYWDRKWSVQSDIDKLEAVLLHRPGEELKAVDDEVKWVWCGKTDMSKAQEEHDNFAKALKEEGVEVVYMHRVLPNKAKSYFTRDYGVMIHGGAIIGRRSLEIRRGEERPHMERLIQLGIPILRTIHGTGTFEGGDFIYLDEKSVAIGVSIRTNQEGIRQVSEVLKVVGIEEVLEVPVPGYYTRWPSGFSHLDMAFTVINEKLALIYPEGVPFWFLEYVKQRGFRLIEVPPEEVWTMAANVLVVRPGKLIMAAKNDKTRKMLEKEGVDVIEVVIDELQKGGGGPRCMSFPLMRKR